MTGMDVDRWSENNEACSVVNRFDQNIGIVLGSIVSKNNNSLWFLLHLWSIISESSKSKENPNK